MPEDRNYTPTIWVDHYEDPATGEVFQQGTPVDAQHLNNIEGGIVDAHYKADEAKQVANAAQESANGKAPSGHTHTPEQAGAAPSNHTHTPEQAGASPSNHSHNLLTYTATHSKSGTVHTLTGLPTAAGIYIAQFKAVANFDAGNTFAGGYTAKPMGEETALPDKAFIAGDLVSVVVDVSGKKLGFRLGGAGAPKFPTYTGSHAIFGTEKQGYMELYSSGTLTAQANMTVEAFLVGGGASGASLGYGSNNQGGSGGGGGSVKLLTGLALQAKQTYPAVIGAGGVAVYYNTTTSGTSGPIGGGSTTAFGNTVNGGQSSDINKGSNGGSGGGSRNNGTGAGGDGGVNGGDGVSTIGDAYKGIGDHISTTFNSKVYANGGSGGGSTGGTVGAGAGKGGSTSQNGLSALPNTGCGGGGCGAYTSNPILGRSGGNGGSGIIIIRWGY